MYSFKNFLDILTTPDNVPILLLIAMIVAYTWISFHKAFDNDKRLAQGRPVWEGEPHNQEKVHTWPHLLNIEFIVSIIAMAGLTLWSTFLNAPLEDPANNSVTPNPSKAPWYFLGLQEMLVYFDPWIAGVVLPGIIVVGLIAIPYIDTNPKGNGYYSWRDRRFAIGVFLFGWFLWMALIIEGTILRGPGWNFFMPGEYWDVHKQVALVNINFSELLNIDPKTFWLARELPAIIILGLYFTITPFLVAKFNKKFYEDLGLVRYGVTIMLLLLLVGLPVKMILRLTINLKYILVTPWFNI
ncbi:MAG: cytochrome C [Candidatus Sericytochromatia bacterium]|nr:cytochrome C [Candidatus Sericytochromatia bacterium]